MGLSRFSSPIQFLSGSRDYTSKNTKNYPPILPPDIVQDVSDKIGPHTAYESTVGLQRLQLLGKMAEKEVFLTKPLNVDHYGTLENPILVDTVVGERLVGCTGFPKYSHRPLWLWITRVSLIEATRCPDCGQAFRANIL